MFNLRNCYWKDALVSFQRRRLIVWIHSLLIEMNIKLKFEVEVLI